MNGASNGTPTVGRHIDALEQAPGIDGARPTSRCAPSSLIGFDRVPAIPRMPPLQQPLRREHVALRCDSDHVSEAMLVHIARQA